MVDTVGLLIAVTVTTACVQDRDGLKKLLRTFGVHRKKLQKIWVDGGYRGEVIEWVKHRFRYCLEVVLRSDEVKGFVVLPKRWIVERFLRGSLIIGGYQKIKNAIPKPAKQCFKLQCFV